MAMSKGSRFQKGSGCYTCTCCKKLTRSTGRGDNEMAKMCADCFDLAGIENYTMDNTVEDAKENYGAEVKAILARRPELIEKFTDLKAIL